MASYEAFAYVYDEYMDNIPYDDWCKYLLELLDRYGAKKGDNIADLGCGTGNVTMRLSKAGFSMVGLDLSTDMLTVAAEKMSDSSDTIIYSCQDIRDFTLPFRYDYMTSIGDSMNYMTSLDDLKSVFRSVRDNLNDGGAFIFDLKTRHFFKDIVGDNTYAENREDSAFIWDNYYDDESDNNEYQLAVFIKDEDEDLFVRYEEEHYQHGFSLEEVKKSIEEAGLKLIDCFNAFTYDAASEDDERWYFIVTNKLS